MSTPIPNLHVINDTFATGAQPGPAAFEWLRDNGYSTVINLNLPAARNFLHDEPEIVARAGMRYIGMPTDCSSLSPSQYEAFKKAATEASARGKVFVHCAANIKSTGFMHLFRVLELGVPPHDALADLKNQPSLEPKWFAFFERMVAGRKEFQSDPPAERAFDSTTAQVQPNSPAPAQAPISKPTCPVAS